MIPNLVIGGGITGAWIAYLLASQGQPVTLVTPATDAPMASHINPGGINPLHGPGIPGVMEAFSLDAYHLHLQHWDRIRNLSGIDFDGRIIERLLLAFTPDEKQALLDNMALYRKNPGFSAEWLEAGEIPLRDDRLTHAAVGGLYTRGNATVDAEKYTAAVLAAARTLGATIIDDAIQALVATAEGYTATGNQEQYNASRVVVATGAQGARLLQSLGIDLPLRPIKGQLLLLEITDAPFRFDITREKDGLYQFRDNLYWLGGTREDVGFDYSTTERGAGEILGNAACLIPCIRSYPVRGHHAAMRPGTPDGLPVLGPFRNFPGLFIASGGGSKGMLWSAGMAASIVDCLLGKPDITLLASLSPDRFTKRN